MRSARDSEYTQGLASLSPSPSPEGSRRQDWLEAYWSGNVEPLIPWSNDLDGPWLKAVRTDDPQEFPVTTPDTSITFDAESSEITPAARLRIMVAWALATQLFFAIDDRHCGPGDAGNQLSFQVVVACIASWGFDS